MVEKVSDFKMPEKVVTKLLKDALPDNVLVSKDAKNAACRSASIFILQLSIAAAEKAQHNKRRTLENQDIIKAVTDLGLGEYAPQLVRFGAHTTVLYLITPCDLQPQTSFSSERKRNARRRESSLLKTKVSKKAPNDDVDPHDTPEPNDNDLPEIDSQELPSLDEEDLLEIEE